jgi:hypothetical protein
MRDYSVSRTAKTVSYDLEIVVCILASMFIETYLRLTIRQAKAAIVSEILVVIRQAAGTFAAKMDKR